ncbi:MAG: ATP-dependent helicase [Candidatus Dojkabacteria bacterium]
MAVDLVKELNTRQAEAVLHEGSPLLILAGAGSGKTKVLTHRMAHLVLNRDIAPQRILGVTFTNKAAKEMRSRIERLVGGKTDFSFLGTFHSICVRILKVDGEHVGLEPTFTIYDTTDQKDMVKEAMKSLNMDIREINPNGIHWAISSAKNDLIDHKKYGNLVGDLFTEQVARVYPVYQELLQERNAVDFDDLIMKTIKLFETNEEIKKKYIDRFDEILVDEYQDTNPAQYRLIKLLAQDKQNIGVVGDEDQSIYGWRGADIKNILSFEKDFTTPKVIKLEQNYRSTQKILDAAHFVIHKNTERREKKLWSDKKEGPDIKLYQAQTEADEARFITATIKKMVKKGYPEENLHDVAVLYRANAQSRAIEEQFLRAKIPYKLVGGQRFYDRKEIKDVLAYLRIFYNPADSLSLMRIINTPARGIGPKTITDLIETSKNLNIPIVDLLSNLALLFEFKDEIDDYEKKQREKHTPGNEVGLLNEDSHEDIDEFVGSLAEFRQTLKDSKLLTNRPVINVGLKLKQIREDTLESNVTEFIKYVLEEMDYLAHINDNTKEGESRLENIKEFLSVSEKYNSLGLDEGLAKLIEDVSLIEDIQEREDEKGKKAAVNLMTMHAAKGLEFDTVFVGGMEENIFPHSRTLTDPKEMEEERRLAYVAITRAKNNLYLLYAVARNYFGSYQSNPVSRFIGDIPEYLLEVERGYEPVPEPSRASEPYSDVEEVEAAYIDVGDMVYHEQFGEGKVKDIEYDMITIDFIDKGTTKLMAQFAKLKKI